MVWCYSQWHSWLYLTGNCVIDNRGVGSKENSHYSISAASIRTPNITTLRSSPWSRSQYRPLSRIWAVMCSIPSNYIAADLRHHLESHFSQGNIVVRAHMKKTRSVIGRVIAQYILNPALAIGRPLSAQLNIGADKSDYSSGSAWADVVSSRTNDLRW